MPRLVAALVSGFGPRFSFALGVAVTALAGLGAVGVLGWPGGRCDRDAPHRHAHSAHGPDAASRASLAALVESCTDAELGCPRPILPVHDLQDALDYYRDVLGFAIDWEYGDPADFASVTRGDATFFLSSYEGHGYPGTWSVVFARDVDDLYSEFLDQGAYILLPPTDMPWGMREMHVSDADGNVIRFGGSIEHDD